MGVTKKRAQNNKMRKEVQRRRVAEGLEKMKVAVLPESLETVGWRGYGTTQTAWEARDYSRED